VEQLRAIHRLLHRDQLGDRKEKETKWVRVSSEGSLGLFSDYDNWSIVSAASLQKVWNLARRKKMCRGRADRNSDSCLHTFTNTLTHT
jgi:hypothetical protein